MLPGVKAMNSKATIDQRKTFKMTLTRLIANVLFSTKFELFVIRLKEHSLIRLLLQASGKSTF